LFSKRFACVVSMLSKIEARLEGTSCKTRGSFLLLERGEVKAKHTCLAQWQ